VKKKKTLKATTPAKEHKIPPVLVPAPKIRVPNAPAEREHRDRRMEEKVMPSGRRAKHKKKLPGPSPL
jgi:hypothetical protein